VPAQPAEFYAHSLPDQPPEKWQRLEEHLENVAELAAKFARPFGGQEWAYLAGRNHDLGKATPAWQAWLRKVNDVIDEFAYLITPGTRRMPTLAHNGSPGIPSTLASCWLIALPGTMEDCQTGTRRRRKPA